MNFFNPFRKKNDLSKWTIGQDNFLRWWDCVCENYRINTLTTSYQTRLLDKHLQVLSRQLAGLDQGLGYEKNSEINWHRACKRLRAQLLNWKHVHAVEGKYSKRDAPINRLLEWVEDELNKQKKVKQDENALNQDNASNDNSSALKKRVVARPGINRNVTDNHLYAWWKSASNKGWFSRRTEATRELDKSIHWFSTNCMIFRLEALLELMRAIKVWQITKAMEPKKSAREEAVLLLKEFIRAEIESLKTNENRIDSRGEYNSAIFPEITF
jgi:hypothetical protein